jgi:hypothetical protein
MSSLSIATADVIRGQAVVLSNLGDIGGGSVGKIGNALKIYFKEVLGIQALQDLGASTRPRPRAGRSFGGSSIQGNIYDPAAAAKAKADKAAAALAKKQLDATKKLTAEQKKQNTLKKAATIFDLEQVELIAALKGKLSDEDRKRVELQFALLVGNTSEAQKLTYELAKAQGLGEKLAGYLASLPDAKNPFASWEAYLDMLAEKARKIAVGGGAGAAVPITPVTPSVATNATNSSGFAYTVADPSRGGSRDSQFGSQTPWAIAVAALNRPVVVQIDGKAVATSLQDTSMSGITSNINRTSGGFGL